jgi:hypothetical protein
MPIVFILLPYAILEVSNKKSPPRWALYDRCEELVSRG